MKDFENTMEELRAKQHLFNSKEDKAINAVKLQIYDEFGIGTVLQHSSSTGELKSCGYVVGNSSEGYGTDRFLQRMNKLKDFLRISGLNRIEIKNLYMSNNYGNA